MRLYSLTGATAVDDPQCGHIKAGDDGAFDFPNELSDRLHGTAVAGRKQWETEMERATRLAAEEAARRADPATLLEAVQQLVDHANAQRSATEEPAKPPAARTAPRKAAASKQAAG